MSCSAGVSTAIAVLRLRALPSGCRHYSIACTTGPARVSTDTNADQFPRSRSIRWSPSARPASSTGIRGRSCGRATPGTRRSCASTTASCCARSTSRRPTSPSTTGPTPAARSTAARPGRRRCASSPTRPAGRRRTRSASARSPTATVVAIGGLMYRDDPEKSVVNVPTLGYSEMDLILLRSRDRGRTWSAPEIDRAAARRARVRGLPRDRGDPRRALGLADVDVDGLGRRGAQRDERDPARVGGPGPDVARRTSPSSTAGPRTSSTGSRASSSCSDGRWLAVAWVGRPGHVQGAADAVRDQRATGKTFDVHGLTGFRAQTTKLVELPDGRILAAYRRNDEPGLWATIARIEGDTLGQPRDGASLWRGPAVGHDRRDEPGRGAGAAEVRLPADGRRARRLGLPRLLVRGGLHQEHPLAAPRRLTLAGTASPGRPISGRRPSTPR